MSYYGEWKMFKRELEEELAKPEPGLYATVRRVSRELRTVQGV